MDTSVDIIRDHLHPKPYPQAVEDVADIPLLLLRRSLLGAKYALAVVGLEGDGLTAKIGRVRRIVDEYTDSSFLTGCGLIILFLAPEADWPPSTELPPPDVHGLRSTIVQGLVWLDPMTGIYRTSRSQWGPIKFGNLQGQMTALQKLLDEWPLTTGSS